MRNLEVLNYVEKLRILFSNIKERSEKSYKLFIQIHI